MQLSPPPVCSETKSRLQDAEYHESIGKWKATETYAQATKDAVPTVAISEFALLDLNGDGVVDKEDWDNYFQPNPDPNPYPCPNLKPES